MKRIAIHPHVLDVIAESRPPYLDLTAFINQTLHNALTGQGTVSLQGLKISTAEEQPAVDVKPKAEPTNKEKTVRASKPKNIVPTTDNVPEGHLKPHADLLLDCWVHRKKEASRTQRAWNGFIKLADQILTDHGEEVFIAHVNKAADAGWHTLHPEYITQDKLARETGAPVSKHPAHKVFKANDLGPEWDRPATNPVLENLF